MPHVKQSFLMHRFVLEDREHGVCTIEQRIARTLQILMRQRIDDACVGFCCERAHDVLRRPSFRFAATLRAAVGRSRLRFVRVDASREQRFQPRVDAGLAKRLFHERVEAEAREVAVVKHDRMPQVDRTLVIDVLREHVKQRARPVPVVLSSCVAVNLT
jgi:hypothetical protein